MIQNILIRNQAFGIGWLDRALAFFARDPSASRLGPFLVNLTVPIIAIGIFLVLWNVGAAQVETSLGQLPGPAKVWEQAQALYQEHLDEHERARQFHERQAERNARKLAEDPNAQVKWRPYTGAPTFFDQILTSIWTVMTGFLLGSIIAIPIGVLAGMSPLLYKALNPLIQLFKPVSPLAWLPLVTMVVSALYVAQDPMLSKSFLNSAITVMLCCLWPTIINTTVGVSTVSQDLINVSRVLRLSWWTRVWRIVLPSALPMLKIAQGEFVTLIGHSGCGKSTLLNLIAGLLRATEGGVILDGTEVTEPGPERAVVFQNHSLLPWLSAYENVALAVRQVFKGRKSRREMDEWIRHNLELVHMGHALHKRPGELSGGMKQRVGIARALAMEPKVLLLDEPFGALDALTRSHMQDSLMEIHARLNNTVVMITHDVDEAVLLSDRIVMMTNGPAATIGEILEVDLLRPRSRLELADDPTYNHYRAEVVRFLHERHARPAVDAAETAPPSRRPRTLREVTYMSEWRQTHRGTGKALEKSALTLGFIPLTDCAPLVIAKEQGFFARYGLDVTLSRETSWANIRDKTCIGLLDGAHMLAGIPLASRTAMAPMCSPMVTALSLDLNGNAITVSNDLFVAMAGTGVADVDTPVGAARALEQVIDENRAAGGKPLTFATVFPYSSHNFLLRYWMASAGIDPDREVRLTVVPPPQMVNYLRAGVISGYCVGEPWNAHAVNADLGRVVATSHAIWNNHPEKVFGVSRAWAQANPNTHQAVLMALMEAAAWLDAPDNRIAACAVLSKGRYVNAPEDVLRMSLTGTYQFGAQEPPRAVPDFNVFHRYAANYPWVSHGVWTLSQMVRWGQIDRPLDLLQIAREVYKPRLYRQAAEALGWPVPAADTKVEGGHDAPWTLDTEGGVITMGPDRFMDGGRFDAGDVAGYLARFEVAHLRFGLDELRAAAVQAVA